jgi:hypothetical protein
MPPTVSKEEPVLKLHQVFAAVALLAIAAPAATPKQRPAKDNGQNSIVIVFKDGREQSFSLAEIDRIEFSSPAQSALPVGSARFLGDWKVGDGMGGTFIITLKPDGKAHKTNGGGGEGTWKAVNGEARISWDDGWHDVLRKVGNKYEKAAYAPGRSLNDEPSNVAEAVYTEPN